MKKHAQVSVIIWLLLAACKKNDNGNTLHVVLPPPPAVAYTFKIDKVFPHDTSCYTEGLLYLDGYLYESGGGTTADGVGQSSLRKTDLATGNVLQKVMVDPKAFAEGIAIVGDKILQLTWTHPKVVYVYDKSAFNLLNTYPNNVGAEGWGLCYDGGKLFMSDGTNRVYFLDKDTYQQTGYIDVRDENGPVDQINELEYIDGKLYANIWLTNYIIVIDPKTGLVSERIDLTNLYPAPRTPPADVLNGIAYDAVGKRIFITGKKWPFLYQVEFVKK
jgi:glutamine cyclotransferase